MSEVRKRARQRAVQALYQWQITGQNLSEIESQFLVEQDMARVQVPYFKELLHQIPGHLAELDKHITPFLDRPLEGVDPVERVILRLGAYELQYRLDIPFRVILNEAVELAKMFGAEQSYRYVNSVLDKVARELRQ